MSRSRAAQQRRQPDAGKLVVFTARPVAISNPLRTASASTGKLVVFTARPVAASGYARRYASKSLDISTTEKGK